VTSPNIYFRVYKITNCAFVASENAVVCVGGVPIVDAQAGHALSEYYRNRIRTAWEFMILTS
jgi:hypothetical protein